MAEPNLYDVLGVHKLASTQEIKKAYYKLSKVHHPDKGGDPEISAYINKAYGILSDTSKRTQYDSGTSMDKIKGHAEMIADRVLSVFEEAINYRGFVPDHVDIFKIMREICNEKDRRMVTDIETLSNEIKNMSAIRDRMKNADIFEQHLEQVIGDLKFRIDKVSQEKQSISDILKYIEDCEYEVEEDVEDGYQEQTFEEYLDEQNGE